MKNFLRNIAKQSFKFYKNNGLLGISYKYTFKLRGGQQFPKTPDWDIENWDTPSKEDHKKSSRKFIDNILNDPNVSDEQKRPYKSFLEEGWCDQFVKDKRDRKIKSLHDNIILKCKYPTYNKVKSALPFFILAPFSYMELQRLAIYRAAGFISAPVTLPALIGFAMPCAVAASMAEMYLPDRLKLSCKVIKWGGGFMFYGVCYAVDFATADLEKQWFGAEMSIDATELMGTLPRMADIKSMQKLAASVIKKSSKLGDLDDYINE